MSLREKQKLQTRKHILGVAKELIAEHGFEKTTMRMLSKAAGVGLGTISLHFKDKKTLLLASFHDEIGEVAEKALVTIPADGSVRDQILHSLSCMYGYYAENIKYTKAVVKEALFAEGEWGATFDAQIQEYMVFFSDNLERGKAQGKLCVSADTKGMAMVVWSIYIHGLVEGLKQPVFDPQVQLQAISPLIDALLHGSIPKETT